MRLDRVVEYELALTADMLASLLTWLLLAGFIVLPVTFASLRDSGALNSMGYPGKVAYGAVQNVHILWMAGAFCICGALGLSWLWWENRKNSIWLTDRIFREVSFHEHGSKINTGRVVLLS